jgi:hypothetical protein
LVVSPIQQSSTCNSSNYEHVAMYISCGYVAQVIEEAIRSLRITEKTKCVLTPVL